MFWLYRLHVSVFSIFSPSVEFDTSFSFFLYIFFFPSFSAIIQLECSACGYTWYASRDAISSLTTDAQNVTGNVGTAPQATANFETVEKKLVSPRKSQADAFKKSTDAYFSALETQKSFSKSRTEDPSSAAKH